MNPQAPASTLTVRDMIAVEMAAALHARNVLENEVPRIAYLLADDLIAYSQKKQ